MWRLWKPPEGWCLPTRLSLSIISCLSSSSKTLMPKSDRCKSPTSSALPLDNEQTSMGFKSLWVLVKHLTISISYMQEFTGSFGFLTTQESISSSTYCDLDYCQADGVQHRYDIPLQSIFVQHLLRLKWLAPQNAHCVLHVMYLVAPIIIWVAGWFALPIKTLSGLTSLCIIPQLCV